MKQQMLSIGTMPAHCLLARLPACSVLCASALFFPHLHANTGYDTDRLPLGKLTKQHVQKVQFSPPLRYPHMYHLNEAKVTYTPCNHRVIKCYRTSPTCSPRRARCPLTPPSPIDPPNPTYPTDPPSRPIPGYPPNPTNPTNTANYANHTKSTDLTNPNPHC
jgi:hypothetical protein